MAASNVLPETEGCPTADFIKTALKECQGPGSSISELQFVGNEEDVSVVEEENTEVNYMFCVSSKADPCKSVIVKYAPPFLKSLGPKYPLPAERGELEYKVLMKINAVCPGSVPKPLVYSQDYKVLVMETLQHYTMYRKCLLEGNVDKDLACRLVHIIGTIHQKTHLANIGQDAFQQLEKEFNNPSMKALTDEFTFKTLLNLDPTHLRNHELENEAKKFFSDSGLQDAVQKIRNLFHSKKEALIHGDLHTGSAFVKNKDVRIFDLEHAMVGPCAMDLGVLIANYIFAYYYHMLNPHDNDAHRQVAYKLLDICYASVEEYLTYMTCSIGDRDSYVQQLMSETAGFAGCEIVRRLLSTEHVEEMESSESASVEVLEAGCRLLRAHNLIHSIGHMMIVALMLTY